ncbi:hypothetical protein JTE90_023149 [Oedothorax gibbosus]|uniref:Uncharacterized protein n=1 Tax=Oedothorax gibbosus TaxID=931172 RepID=A0AAV6URS7_9ARAC|nr:hypothetical protein JTE90_023149 [Oedothorax gibbosus]
MYSKHVISFLDFEKEPDEDSVIVIKPHYHCTQLSQLQHPDQERSSTTFLFTIHADDGLLSPTTSKCKT